MTQRRRISALETCVSTGAGFVVSLGAQLLVFPLMGWHPAMAQNLAITTIFTALSLIRGYVVRRMFETARRL